MSSNSSKEYPSAFHRIFRIPRPWKYVFAPAAVMIGTLVLLWIAEPTQAPLALALLAAIMLLGLGIGLLVTSRVSLEVSESMIVFRGWGYSVSSRWEDLLGYSRRPMGLFTVETLILRLPGVQFHPLLEGSRRIYRWISLRGGSHGLGLSEPDWVGIPVGLFAENWRESELGRIVQRYAPKAHETKVA
jgi:hypothetical protein